MPLKTMRRVRFHKVAHGYLFGQPSKKIRIVRSRQKRPNPFHTKESARYHAMRTWGHRLGLEAWYAAERVQAVRELRRVSSRIADVARFADVPGHRGGAVAGRQDATP